MAEIVYPATTKRRISPQPQYRPSLGVEKAKANFQQYRPYSPLNDLLGAFDKVKVGPNEFDAQKAALSQVQAELAPLRKFLTERPLPQYETPNLAPLPERRGVPLPQRGENINERGYRVAGGILSALGGFSPYATLATPGLEERGRYLDERDYADKMANYGYAQDEADRDYQAELLRAQTENQQAERASEIAYRNAQAQYEQGRVQAELQGKEAGVSAISSSVEKLAEQARAAEESQREYERRKLEIQEKARYDEQYQKYLLDVFNLESQAEQLAQQGRVNEAQISLAEAERVVKQVTAESARLEMRQSEELFPLKKEGYRADIGLKKAQTASEYSQAKLNNARAIKESMLADIEKQTAKFGMARAKAELEQIKLAIQREKLLSPIEKQRIQLDLDAAKVAEAQITDMRKFAAGLQQDYRNGETLEQFRTRVERTNNLVRAAMKDAIYLHDKALQTTTDMYTQAQRRAAGIVIPNQSMTVKREGAVMKKKKTTSSPPQAQRKDVRKRYVIEGIGNKN